MDSLFYSFEKNHSEANIHSTILDQSKNPMKTVVSLRVKTASLGTDSTVHASWRPITAPARSGGRVALLLVLLSHVCYAHLHLAWLYRDQSDVEK